MVIIGILTAIAIPSYGAIQHTARVNAVKTSVASQFDASMAKMAKGDTLTPGELVLKSNIRVAVIPHDSSRPISETNLSVQGVWDANGEKADSSDTSGVDYSTKYERYVDESDGSNNDSEIAS